MTPSSPDFLGRFRSRGQEPKLVRETEWTRIYETGPKSRLHHSRFLDEGFEVSAATIRERWPRMNRRERLDFAVAFHCKPEWTENDTEILEVIMRDGDDKIWGALALTFLRHPNRETAIGFLIGQLQEPPDPEQEKIKFNYIQALGLSGDQRAIPAIKPFYERYKRMLRSKAKSELPTDSFWALTPYHEYLCICEALMRTEGLAEYEQEIRWCLNHSDPQVRWWAEHALGIEGPETARRRRKYEEDEPETE